MSRHSSRRQCIARLAREREPVKRAQLLYQYAVGSGFTDAWLLGQALGLLQATKCVSSIDGQVYLAGVVGAAARFAQETGDLVLLTAFTGELQRIKATGDHTAAMEGLRVRIATAQARTSGMLAQYPDLPTPTAPTMAVVAAGAAATRVLARMEGAAAAFATAYPHVYLADAYHDRMIALRNALTSDADAALIDALLSFADAIDVVAVDVPWVATVDALVVGSPGADLKGSPLNLFADILRGVSPYVRAYVAAAEDRMQAGDSAWFADGSGRAQPDMVFACDGADAERLRARLLAAGRRPFMRPRTIIYGKHSARRNVLASDVAVWGGYAASLHLRGARWDAALPPLPQLRHLVSVGGEGLPSCPQLHSLGLEGLTNVPGAALAACLRCAVDITLTGLAIAPGGPVDPANPPPRLSLSCPHAQKIWVSDGDLRLDLPPGCRTVTAARWGGWGAAVAGRRSAVWLRGAFDDSLDAPLVCSGLLGVADCASLDLSRLADVHTPALALVHCKGVSAGSAEGPKNLRRVVVDTSHLSESALGVLRGVDALVWVDAACDKSAPAPWPLLRSLELRGDPPEFFDDPMPALEAVSLHGPTGRLPRAWGSDALPLLHRLTGTGVPGMPFIPARLYALDAQSLAGMHPRPEDSPPRTVVVQSVGGDLASEALDRVFGRQGWVKDPPLI